MAFNVNELKGALKFGGARSAIFEVQLDTPSYLPAPENGAKFLVRAAEIPAASIGVIDVTYFGRPVRFSGNRTFADWTVTVLNDEDFAVRDLMEAWSNSMNSLAGNARLPGIPDNGTGSYKATAQVNQLGKNGELLRQYELQGIFPTEVSTIALDWGTEGIQEFTVTFTYDQWIKLDTGSSQQVLTRAGQEFTPA